MNDKFRLLGIAVQLLKTIKFSSWTYLYVIWHETPLMHLRIKYISKIIAYGKVEIKILIEVTVYILENDSI